MKLLYLDAADSEFDEAIAYYNTKRSGLGFEFADEIKEAVERIKNYPEAWTPLSEKLRRCQVHRFPYSVIYQVRAESSRFNTISESRRNGAQDCREEACFSSLWLDVSLVGTGLAICLLRSRWNLVLMPFSAIS